MSPVFEYILLWAQTPTHCGLDHKHLIYSYLCTYKVLLIFSNWAERSYVVQPPIYRPRPKLFQCSYETIVGMY